MLAKLDLSNNEIESIPDEIGTQEVSNDFHFLISSRYGTHVYYSACIASQTLTSLFPYDR